jgi:hypothetical protein
LRRRQAWPSKQGILGCSSVFPFGCVVDSHLPAIASLIQWSFACSPVAVTWGAAAHRHQVLVFHCTEIRAAPETKSRRRKGQ